MAYHAIIDAILDTRLGPAEADVIRRALGVTPAGRRRARLDARDDALRTLAKLRYAGKSARAAAAALTDDLKRHLYGDLRPCSDPATRRATNRAVLLSDGFVPSAAQARRIIAGQRTPRRPNGA